jgi:hypothetical protein
MSVPRESRLQRCGASPRASRHGSSLPRAAGETETTAWASTGEDVGQGGRSQIHSTTIGSGE